MRKLNVIFTGRYLKFWYVACFIIILIIFANSKINERVSKFELAVYNSDGEMISRQTVDGKQLRAVIAESPVTKSFKPIKR